ncbi:pilus assembly protein TadG-related protein [Ideonella sp. DXS29W]|uniref:Pilus assembly protein TadG-related protein n=1 Tax=Ideonella lacteola TaxID=2984193 RepID=A0ABU9BMU0_9BURK
MKKSKSLARRQSGQAIVWLLGTMAASAAVMLGVYTVGQLTVAKQKTVNAADAAALAGATAEARVLNLIAYNNRSIMANEVFLAQSLSLESWLDYAQHTGDNISIITNFIPYVGPAIARVVKQAATAAGQARNGVSQFINFLIPVMEGIKKGFVGAHSALAFAGGPLAEDAANKVVAANKAAFGVHGDAGVQMNNSPQVRAYTFLANAQEFKTFSRQYTGNQRGDAKQVLLDSRDPFSVDRPGNFLFNITIPFVANEDKRGGTRLTGPNGGFDRWEAQDTLEIATWNWKKADWDWKHALPVGWGRANADRNGSAGDRWGNHPVDSLAYQVGRSHSHRSWTGVPSLFDVRDQSAGNRANLHLDFLVAVERPQANTMTSQNLGMGTTYDATATGSSEMNETLAGNKMSALSKGVVFFERPRRGVGNDATASPLLRPDSAKEYGSLYSPYWQARVTDLTLGEKTTLMALVGPVQNAALVKFTPGGQR